MNRVAIVLACLLMSLGGCSGDDDLEFFTRCGVVVNEKLENPVIEKDGDKVTIRAASDSNVVVVSLDDDDDQRILVKLAGVDNKVEEEQMQEAIDYIQGLNPQARFYRSQKDCTEKVNNQGEAVIGSIITADGINIGEELVLAGLASVDTRGKCKTEVLENCYLALQVEGS